MDKMAKFVYSCCSVCDSEDPDLKMLPYIQKKMYCFMVDKANCVRVVVFFKEFNSLKCSAVTRTSYNNMHNNQVQFQHKQVLFSFWLSQESLKTVNTQEVCVLSL